MQNLLDFFSNFGLRDYLACVLAAGSIFVFIAWVGTMSQGVDIFISAQDRAETIENVTIVGVDFPSSGVFPNDGRMHYRAVLDDGTLLSLSAEDYFSVANRDLPVRCTLKFGDIGENSTILSFDDLGGI